MFWPAVQREYKNIIIAVQSTIRQHTGCFTHSTQHTHTRIHFAWDSHATNCEIQFQPRQQYRVFLCAFILYATRARQGAKLFILFGRVIVGVCMRMRVHTAYTCGILPNFICIDFTFVSHRVSCVECNALWISRGCELWLLADRLLWSIITILQWIWWPALCGLLLHSICWVSCSNFVYKEKWVRLCVSNICI